MHKCVIVGSGFMLFLKSMSTSSSSFKFLSRNFSLLKCPSCCFLQDLTANSKCSLLVARDAEDRTDLVITLHGDAISVSYNLSHAFNSVLIDSVHV